MAGIGAQFNAVSCPAGPTFWSGGVAAYCVAVGSYANTSQQGGALAEVYQGSAWSLEKTPAIAAGEKLSGQRVLFCRDDVDARAPSVRIYRVHGGGLDDRRQQDGHTGRACR